MIILIIFSLLIYTATLWLCGHVHPPSRSPIQHARLL